MRDLAGNDLCDDLEEPNITRVELFGRDIGTTQRFSSQAGIL